MKSLKIVALYLLLAAKTFQIYIPCQKLCYNELKQHQSLRSSEILLSNLIFLDTKKKTLEMYTGSTEIVGEALQIVSRIVMDTNV